MQLAPGSCRSVCLSGMLFHLTLLYNMHEDFWQDYRALPQPETNGGVLVKHAAATFSTASDMSNRRDFRERWTSSGQLQHKGLRQKP